MDAVSPGPIRSVAVVGAGAMGAMYAAHLADAGLDVQLVARGERAARLRDPGVSVNGRPLRAEVTDLDEASGRHTPVDLVLVAVKADQLAEAAEDIAPLIDPHTTIVSVLNGLDSEDVLAHRYGPEGVLLAVGFAMDAQRDGTAVTYRQAGRLALGARVPGQAERLAAVKDAFDAAGLAWTEPADMRHTMWWKFMINTGINQASAVLRAPYGEFVPAGPARSLMLALMGEVVAVARAEGVELGEADLTSWDQVLAAQPPDGRTSMHQDVEAGRPTEVELFAGRVVVLGQRHGIPTPHNETVLWILRALAARQA